METILETKVEFGPGRYEIHGFLHTARNVVEFERITILEPIPGWEHSNIRVSVVCGGECRFSKEEVKKITFNERYL